MILLCSRCVVCLFSSARTVKCPLVYDYDSYPRPLTPHPTRALRKNLLFTYHQQQGKFCSSLGFDALESFDTANTSFPQSSLKIYKLFFLCCTRVDSELYCYSDHLKKWLMAMANFFVYNHDNLAKQ